MSHDYYMVDAEGDPILQPSEDGIVGCHRCGKQLDCSVTSNHTPHIQYALRGTPGIENGYWKWLEDKTGAETAPVLRRAYLQFDADGEPSAEERNAYAHSDADWERYYLPKREEAAYSLRALLRLAEAAPKGRWRCW